MKSRIRTVLLGGLMVMACSAAATASASAASWYVKGKSLNQQEAVTAASATPFTIKTPTLGIAVECKSSALTNAKITPGARGSAEALSLKECKGVGAFKCTIKKPITTAPVSTELFYVNGSEVWADYSPSGETLFTLSLEECGFEGNYEINGKFCSKESAPTAETSLKDQAFGVPSGAAAGQCELKLGTNRTTLEGTMGLSLAGSQLGAVWTGK